MHPGHPSALPVIARSHSGGSRHAQRGDGAGPVAGLAGAGPFYVVRLAIS